MPTLEILIGMIASGKSTYALRRAKEGALVISHDALTAMLHAEYRYEQGKRELYRYMENLLARAALQDGHDVVIDRTHLTLESRQRWISFLSGQDWYQIKAIVFPIESPEEHVRRRMASDPRGRPEYEWLQVARHHYAQAMAEPFSTDEGISSVLLVDCKRVPT